MELSITSALSLFLLVTLSTVVFFASKKIRVPYTILLVAVGLLLVPIVNLPGLRHLFGFISDFVITPELLFYIFLPVLIFESGFNMNMRKMLDSAWALSLFSVVSLLISAGITAIALYYVMPLIGIEMPFIMALLFGAIISPTDPVAALALFKECGVPRRLAMVFEGESLLNDGTAMALFLVILGIAVEGYQGLGTVAHGVFEFSVMIVLGVAIGLIMAAVFSKALNYTKQNDFVTVTLLIVSAHLVFITSELINHSGLVHVSSIIAATVAALFLGNYSRSVLKPSVDEYLSKLVEHMAFVINSLVFLMAGLLFASSGVDFLHLWLPIAVTVLIVASARAISVYAVVLPLNWSRIENIIPSSWTKLLAWASLRGALCIIIVLLIPADYKVEGWTLPYTPRDFLLALTIGCILATLFIKAPLIGPIMRKLRINAPEPLKEAHEADLGVYYILSERYNLATLTRKNFVNPADHTTIDARVSNKLQEALSAREQLVRENGITVFDQSLHLSMVHIEKHAARKLFNNSEMSERTYRKIHSKLCLQQEKIEAAQHNEIDPKAYSDRKDIFDRLVRLVLAPFGEVTAEERLKDRLEFYRAQMIMARKAVDTIETIQSEFGSPVFLPQSFETVCAQYKHYAQRNAEKMNALLNEHGAALAPYLSYLAERALAQSSHKTMDFLHGKGLVDEATAENVLEHFATAHQTV